MWRASSARASSSSWMSIPKPATAPVGSGTLTICSIRRSPRTIAACVRCSGLPLSSAASAAALASSLVADQLARPGDDVGGVAALDRLDEGAVDQAEAEVGAAVPHRERRRFDEVGERVERRFGLRRAAARSSAARPRRWWCRRTTAPSSPPARAPAPAPPRTSSTRPVPARPHLPMDPAARQARPRAPRRPAPAASSTIKPRSSPPRSSIRLGLPSTPSSRSSRGSASIRPPGLITSGRAGLSCSSPCSAEAPDSTACALAMRLAAITDSAMAMTIHSAASASATTLEGASAGTLMDRLATCWKA